MEHSASSVATTKTDGPCVFTGLDSGLDSCGTGLTESCSLHSESQKLRNDTTAASIDNS